MDIIGGLTSFANDAGAGARWFGQKMGLINDVRVPGTDGADIYRWFNDDAPGSDGLQSTSSIWRDKVGDRYRDAETLVRNAMKEATTSWQGQSADAANAGMSPMAKYFQQAGETATAAGDALGKQAESFHETQKTVVNVPVNPPQDHILNKMAPWDTDLDREISDYRSSVAANQRAYESYIQGTNANVAAIPQFASLQMRGATFSTENPTTATDGPERPGSIDVGSADSGDAGSDSTNPGGPNGQDGYRPTDGHRPTKEPPRLERFTEIGPTEHSADRIDRLQPFNGTSDGWSPRSDSAGPSSDQSSGQSWGSSSGQSSGPSWGPSSGPSSGSGLIDLPAGAQTDAAAYQPSPSGFGPTGTGGFGSGGLGGIGGDSTYQGSQYGGAGSAGAFGAGGGVRSGNPTAGLGAGPGARQPGGGVRAGTGTPGAPGARAAAGMAETAAGRSGAGRGGMMGAPVGATGRGDGDGDEDTEHTTKYLIDEDRNDLFGTDEKTAPPVIGE